MKAISFSHSALSFVLLLSCRNLLKLYLLLSFPRICVWSTFGWSTWCYWLEGYTGDAVQVLLQRYNFLADAEKRKRDKSIFMRTWYGKKRKKQGRKPACFFFQMFVFLFVSYSFFCFVLFFFHILFIFIFFQDEENEWMTFYKYRYVVKLLEPVPKE